MKIVSKQNMSRVCIILFSFIVFLAGVQADDGFTSNSWSYLFRLYYDNGNLSADRDFEFKYDLIAESFQPDSINISNPFRGEVINIKNEKKSEFRFDPKQGNPAFTKGKVSVKGPYFADAMKVNFYDGDGKLLFTLNVSGSSFCNDNKICNSDVGENSQNCPNDCKEIIPTGPSVTPSSTPIVSAGELGNYYKILIYIIVGGGLVAGVVWWFLKKKSTPPSNNIPPQI